MLIKWIVKSILGIPKEAISGVVESLSEKDKEKLRILAKEVLKAAVAGATQTAVNRI